MLDVVEEKESYFVMVFFQTQVTVMNQSAV